MHDLRPLISEIATDRLSGASEILERAILVLRKVMSRRSEERLEIARAICRAQPGMAPVWNAALSALQDDKHPGSFDRFVERARRAPSALARFTCQLFAEPDKGKEERNGGPLSLITVSHSGSVRLALKALAAARRLHVACAEGRPAFEGRRMATSLAEAGVAVTLFSDAAISEALPGADAVVVGADAVATDWFANKVGTRMLAAAAALTGVPVYAIASREKFCAPSLEPRVMPREGAAREIWDTPGSGITVRNPYFERVPLSLLLAVVTDGGIMPAESVAGFCGSLASAEIDNQLGLLCAVD